MPTAPWRAFGGLLLLYVNRGRGDDQCGQAHEARRGEGHGVAAGQSVACLAILAAYQV
jgi:hypothetical protein